MLHPVPVKQLPLRFKHITDLFRLLLPAKELTCYYIEVFFISQPQIQSKHIHYRHFLYLLLPLTF